jgi:hypothetical protein
MARKPTASPIRTTTIITSLRTDAGMATISWPIAASTTSATPSLRSGCSIAPASSFGGWHRKPLSGKSAAYEECMAQAFQAYLRGNQEPIIAGVDWFGMKRAALRLLALRIEPRP